MRVGADPGHSVAGTGSRLHSGPYSPSAGPEIPTFRSPPSTHLGQVGNKLGVTEGLVVAHVGVDPRGIDQERLGEVSIRQLQAQPPRPREAPSRDVNTQRNKCGRDWETCRQDPAPGRPRSGPNIPSQTNPHTPTVPPNWSQRHPNTSKHSPTSIPTTPTTLSATCGHRHDLHGPVPTPPP